MEQIEVVREIRRWGNSAGILLPREFIGKEARVVVIDRSLDIRKEVLDMLKDYLRDILGIYLTGSYARGEESWKSDIDVIAISKSIKKEIKSGKYHISITTLESIKKTMEKHPELVLPRILEAKAIMNASLLEELKKTKINKSSFKEFIEDTKRIIKINKGFIELNKEQDKEYVDDSTVYSLILRLRGIFLIKLVIKNKKYEKKGFLLWLKREMKEEVESIYEVYESVRDEKKINVRISIKTAEKLLNLLKKEVKRYRKS